MRLPEGEPAAYRGDGALEFPVGTVLVKTFYYPQDLRVANGPRRLVETRLLIRRADGWVGLPYVWNEEQTDAELRITGARIPVAWIDARGSQRRADYRVPSVADCGRCHGADPRSMAPLGAKPPQLNRSDQLERWSRSGLLVGLPALERVSRFPVWNDEASGPLADRARAYLDANCAHCHGPGGPASGSQLDLRYSERDPTRFGVFKRSVAAGPGSGDLVYDIVPGRPDASILVHRMASVEPGVMMPELGRTIADDEGTALVRAWIASLR